LYTRTPEAELPITIDPWVKNDLPDADAALSRMPLFTIYARPDSTVLRFDSSGTAFIMNASLILSLDL
jgi:hypothetical protein